MAAELEAIYRRWAGLDDALAEAKEHIHPDRKDGGADILPLGNTGPVVKQLRALGRDDGAEEVSTFLDVVIADPDEKCIAARLYTQTNAAGPFAEAVGLPTTGEPFRVFSHELVWFRDDKVYDILTLIGMNEPPQRLSPSDTISASHRLELGTKKLANGELKSFYHSYIDAINVDLSEAALANFVHAEVTHNGQHLSLAQYVDLISESSSAFDNMIAHVYTVVANEEKQCIAARIEWAGTLVKPLRGVEPNGRSVQFTEIVFYGLESGKFVRVWSVVDWDMFKAQMMDPVEEQAGNSKK
ncbi:SnoaL-like polyketide cyclase [Seiridium cupressi]